MYNRNRQASSGWRFDQKHKTFQKDSKGWNEEQLTWFFNHHSLVDLIWWSNLDGAHIWWSFKVIGKSWVIKNMGTIHKEQSKCWSCFSQLLFPQGSCWDPFGTSSWHISTLETPSHTQTKSVAQIKLINANNKCWHLGQQNKLASGSTNAVSNTNTRFWHTESRWWPLVWLIYLCGAVLSHGWSLAHLHRQYQSRSPTHARIPTFTWLVLARAFWNVPMGYTLWDPFSTASFHCHSRFPWLY